MDSPTPPPKMTIQQFKSRFDIIKTMGSGSFGQVLHVYDRENKKEYGLKVIPMENLDKDSFEHETTTLESVASQCTAKGVVCYDGHFVVTEKGRPIFVGLLMELVPGRNLGRILKDINQGETEPYSDRQLKRIADRLFGAVQYIHDLGIIHGDIKPDNVMINEFKPTLIDFGLAFTPLWTWPPLMKYRNSGKSISKDLLEAGDRYAAALTIYDLSQAPNQIRKDYLKEPQDVAPSLPEFDAQIKAILRDPVNNKLS